MAGPGEEMEAVREHDRFLPIANIARIMKAALPGNGEIVPDAARATRFPKATPPGRPARSRDVRSSTHSQDRQGREGDGPGVRIRVHFLHHVGVSARPTRVASQEGACEACTHAPSSAIPSQGVAQVPAGEKEDD